MDVRENVQNQKELKHVVNAPQTQHNTIFVHICLEFGMQLKTCFLAVL